MLHRVKILPKEGTTNGWFAAMGEMTPAHLLAGTVAVEWLIIGGGWVGLSAEVAGGLREALRPLMEG